MTLEEGIVRQTCIVLCLLALAHSLLADDLGDESWFDPVNGMQAQLTMKEATVVNGTPIISTYLTLRNVSDVGNPMKIQWQNTRLSVWVVDEKGNELPKCNGPYDGGRAIDVELVLPYDSSLTFNVSQTGLGIPKGKSALLDLGPMNSWIIDNADGKRYFLRATLTIEDSRKPNNQRCWHGTIQIPKAEIPVRK